MTTSRADRLWLQDTLSRISLRYGNALHALSLLPGPIALAGLWELPEATDVQDAAQAIEANVVAAITELERIHAYVVALTDPGTATCAACGAYLDALHRREGFVHWRWAEDAEALVGRRYEEFHADHDARPVWAEPERPDWSTDDTDLTADDQDEHDQQNQHTQDPGGPTAKQIRRGRLAKEVSPS